MKRRKIEQKLQVTKGLGISVIHKGLGCEGWLFTIEPWGDYRTHVATVLIASAVGLFHGQWREYILRE
tara:strand:- start:1426 stop:1629 length:204 start_codon:yes stop_codon:yes gene_type:complete